MSGLGLPTYTPPGVAIKINGAEFAKKGIKDPASHLVQFVKESGFSDNFVPKLQPMVKDPKNREVLREHVKRAQKLDPTYIPEDFDAWYEFIFEPKATAPNGNKVTEEVPDVADIAHLLNEIPGLVDHAHTTGNITIPAFIDPSNDPRAASQGYLNEAPQGVGARYAWNFPGGDGDRCSVTDIEWGWNVNHEDLRAKNIRLLGGDIISYIDHGTPVMGIMLMTDNTVGGVGIAPSAGGNVISITNAAGGGLSIMESVALVLANRKPDEIIIIEIQVNYRPVEIQESNWQAIRLATANGITVIEPAGNGNVDLDAWHNGDGKTYLNRNTAHFRDSGAVMVGAGSSGVPHTKLGFSNYGSRIDNFGWGENVVSSTSRDLNDHTSYTNTFSGTSSASPIVAGAALAVQGLYRERWGNHIPPDVLRDVLKRGGTPSANPASDKIGVMPNLRAIIHAHFWPA